MPPRRPEDPVDPEDRADQDTHEAPGDAGTSGEDEAEREPWEPHAGRDDPPHGTEAGSAGDEADHPPPRRPLARRLRRSSDPRSPRGRERLADGAPRTEGGPAVWDPRTGAWARPDELRPVFTPPDRRGRGGGLRTAIIGGLIGALVASAATFGIVQATTEGTTERIVERRLSDPITAGSDSGDSIVAIAERARPWVVNINVETRRPGLFGNQLQQGTGSGVILRSDGHIITNAHVVQGAEGVRVTLANGDDLPAEVVGADPDTDVAVIKVDRSGLPTAVLGTAGDLKVGELTVAIGSPLGLRQSVTAGIISALGRTVDRPEQPPLVDMIQTDAAITQGNSGGALLDGNGALIGINTAIAASPDVGAEGIAFAIPVDIVEEVAEELIATGRATHPWLGIVGGNIDAETARQFGIGQGARVIEVVSGSPADEAGLRRGDIIVGFDDETITSMDELVVEIRRRGVDATVPLEVVRDGETLELEATLADRPENL